MASMTDSVSLVLVRSLSSVSTACAGLFFFIMEYFCDLMDALNCFAALEDVDSLLF